MLLRIGPISYCPFHEIQDLLARTQNEQPLHWSKTLESYYERPEWEMYDLKHDPEEIYNVAQKHSYKVQQQKYSYTKDYQVYNFLYRFEINCPECDGKIPLSDAKPLLPHLVWLTKTRFICQ